MSRKKSARKKKVTPLIPPATEAEKDFASRVWTEAQDVMVERGYGRHLWGNMPSACHEFVILMIRQTKCAS